jgi:N-acyl-L-homoserine lactone synthetase
MKAGQKEAPVQFVNGTSTTLTTEVMRGLARYRHRVFVEMLGWPLQTREHGLEFDQFDREDTVYVVARKASGDVFGTARLLPTAKPYLLGELFPQLLHGQPLPSTPGVWELSRFAAVDFNGAKTGPMSPMCQLSPMAVDMLCATMRVAADLGAERLITVTWLGVERLLRKSGFRAHRAAPPIIVDGEPLLACWIDLDIEARNARDVH